MKKVVLLNTRFVNYRMKLLKLLNEKYNFSLILTRVTKEQKEKLNLFRGADKLKYEISPYISFKGFGLSYGLFYKIPKKRNSVIIGNNEYCLETHLAFYLSKLFRKKFIFYSEFWGWKRRPSSKLLMPSIKLIARKSDAIIATSEKVKRYFVNLGANSKKIHIATLSSEIWEPKNKKENFKMLNEKYNIKNKKIILYFGRLVEYKGLDYLIKAIMKLNKEFNNIVLLVGGKFDKRKEAKSVNFEDKINKLIKDNNLKNVHLLGFVPDDQKGYLLDIANVFVVPSRYIPYNAESWGINVNEAMASGKPVIATDAVGSAFSLIENGINGYTIKHSSVDALYGTLRIILKNPKLEKEMGKNSKRIFEEKATQYHTFQGFSNAIEYVLSK